MVATKQLIAAYKDGRTAGIKEVVEWIDNNSEPGYDEKEKTYKYLLIDKTLWQGQLKELGIENIREDMLA